MITVKDMFDLLRASETDFDFSDDYDERAWCAYCGTKLSEEGEKHYARALALPVVKFTGETFIVGCKNGKDAQVLSDLLHDMAGYCPESEWDKYFVGNDD